MSDRMKPLHFDRLLNWVLCEYEQQKAIFGVYPYFKPDGAKSLSLFGEKLEAPFGLAAGPHTQLAQNIIAAYAAGSRFFELKTVQTLDGEALKVAKPCINAADECYNVEWSTELSVVQALDEYIKSWFMLKLISREFGLGSRDGFIFNMSVGYDLAGIKSQKIDSFIEGLKNAGGTEIWNECRAAAIGQLNRFKNVDIAYVESISPKICNSVTLSTMHGCPPQEIERIVNYLISEKGLNTFVKCNPTLLGYDFARKTLDGLGFDYLRFDRHHFKDDLQFEDAVPMFRRLKSLAEKNELSFGVKLSNTLPVDISEDELPGEEMYMSGRALFPLTISLASKLSREFGGRLRVSYSGGADAFNIADIFACGIWPITLATTLLKPGGYRRLAQMAEALGGLGGGHAGAARLSKLDALASDALQSPHYHKPVKAALPTKLREAVPLTDCFMAPCRGGCPIGQDIPAYLRLAGEGNYLEALKVILDKNPLPFITGTICSHRCMDKCTRVFYEEPVHIREVKLEAAKQAGGQFIAQNSRPGVLKDAPKTAVVGGGPAGLSAAYLLAREGMPVTVFEKEALLGGVVRHIVPEFRITPDVVDRDIELVKSTGAEFVTGRAVTSIEELRKLGYEYIILATGAWKPGTLKLEAGGAVDALEFLGACRKAPGLNPYGRNIVVIGGGNTAMDAARAAKRLPGVEKVSVVYRRTRRYMPADEEELLLAVQDGVEFREQLAPVKYENGTLSCRRTVLGEPDASGRRSPVETDETVAIAADAVIAAVGGRIDENFFKENGIGLDERGRVKFDKTTLETGKRHVFVAGDACRGPATIVEAIADATRAAGAICDIHNSNHESLNINPDDKPAHEKKGVLCTYCSARGEGGRCLECATVCENCVDVCPNRANVSVLSGGSPQIIHLDGLCNECGNCATFCPYSSAPYRDKFTLFNTQEDFEASENQGFLPLDAEGIRFRVRLNGRVAEICAAEPGVVSEELRRLMLTVLENYRYILPV